MLRDGTFRAEPTQAETHQRFRYELSMSEPHDRLKQARERQGWKSASEAARAFNWSIDSYKSHENGLRGMKLAVARKYAKAYRVAPEWILFGKSPPAWVQSTPMTVSTNRVPTRLAPVLQWNSVATYLSTTNSTVGGVLVLDEREIAVELGSKTFLLRVEDDAMTSATSGISFGVGDMVACNPEAPVKPGDFVIAIPDAGPDVVLRQLRQTADGTIKAFDLLPLNQNYPILSISGKKAGRILARVVSHTRTL